MDECWIATDVFIAPGVIIERGSVVGARSSVYKNLPSNKICIGSPAEIIGDRIYPQ
jgi:putative colanic acid biosynthesis acetyltransferase WcaF